MSLETKMVGLTFKNPLMAGCAGITETAKLVEKWLKAGAGGILAKTITTDPKLRTSIRPTFYPLNRYGLKGAMTEAQLLSAIPPDVWAKEEAPRLREIYQKYNARWIQSIVGRGMDLDDWGELAQLVEKAGAEAIELDLGCPLAPGESETYEEIELGEDPGITAKLVAGVKKAVKIPVGIKLSPTIRRLDKIAIAAQRDGGADFCTAINAPGGFSIDVEREVIRGVNTLVGYIPGPSHKWWGLAKVAQIKQACDIEVSGCGGIFTANDAIEYILLGCPTIQIVSSVYFKGEPVFAEILNGIEAFMERKGYNSINDFEGKVLAQLKAYRDIPHEEVMKFFPSPIVAKFDVDKRGYPPCQSACPAGVNAQGYIALTSQGKFREALEVLRQTMPLAGVCGRVCTHPCETDCERGEVDEPVSIRSLKRFMADYELRVGREKATPIERTKGDKVAIIGSGPAGLACAYDLVREGYPVTVFESAPQVGGLLRYGIPEYRLPKVILDDEISYVEELGMEIKTGTPVKNLADIFNQGYKTVFIATGAGTSQKMGIPNEKARGVIHALDLLKQVNSGEKVSLGDRVAVIGGSNAAIDAARVAVRLGAKEVSIVYRRSRAEMLAVKTEVDQAEREGVKINILAAPVRVLTKDDRVIGIQCIRMELGEPDASGRPRPIPIKGSEFEMDVDSVIIAIGQAVDSSMLPRELEYTDWGALSIDPVTMQTNIERVFAGGDVVVVADVIKAIAAGKEAAISIKRYLDGMDLKEGRPAPLKRVEEVSKEGVKIKARRAMPLLEPEKRVALAEVELGFDEKTAIEEAQRCLNCGVCLECMQCVTTCIHDAIEADKDLGIIKIDADVCEACGFCSALCPRGAISIVHAKTGKVVWSGEGAIDTSWIEW